MQENSKVKLARIDEAAALAALDGDRTLLGDLATMFAEDAPQVVSDIQIALRTDQPSDVRRGLHSLKGLISTFYASEARDLAERLEQDAIALQFDNLKTGGLDALEQAVECVINDLKTRGLVQSSD